MPQVSKKKMTAGEWKRIWERFVRVLEKSGEEHWLEDLMLGLLTETEKVMLAKRLTVGLMLKAGWEVRDIARQCSLSESTVYKLKGYWDLDQSYRKLLGKVKIGKMTSEKTIKPKSEMERLLEAILMGKTHRSKMYNL